MGALFSRPKTPAAPPPPPNPSVAANPNASITGSSQSIDKAGGTLMTTPGGAPEMKTTQKNLLGQ